MRSYFQGETAIISAAVTDSSGVATDPDTITCTIYDTTDLQKTTGNMTKDATGSYHCDYDIASDALTGVWTALVTAVLTVRTVKEEIEFIVTTK